MNTLAHASAIIASLALAVYCYQTLGNAFLGFAAIGLALLFMVLLGVAVMDDRLWMQDRTRDRDR